MTNLLLGPILRYVDDTSATVWVETDAPCTVEVLGHAAHTFRVGEHHYALVAVRGLRPGTSTPYEVHLDGFPAWPDPARDHPAGTIRTVPNRNDTALRLLFGSCRFGRTEDPRQNRKLGPDALEGYARLMSHRPEHEWPHAMLLLGDQVYADETAPDVQRLLAARRDLGEPPGTEVADFEEYTRLYRHAWSSPPMRWLLSALPSMMIFDDHDVRDDWNTSHAWRARMARTNWWHERLLGALVSYWIYQHIGNLAPETLDDDELYQQVLRVGRDGDALPLLREFASAADGESSGTKGTRWSYRRDLGPARLVVVDTRGGRILDSGARSMLSERDFEWVGHSTESGHEHLLLASSLPWLLPPVVHHVQSWNEAACTRPGPRARLAERLRQAGDFEHWAAFRASFDRLSDIIGHLARRRPGNRGDADSGSYSTISVLSGDVHHSYVADAHYRGGQPPEQPTPVVQVTCSPMHNTIMRGISVPLRLAWSPLLARCSRWLAGRAGVAPPAVRWSRSAGPYFGNTVGVMDLHGDRAELCLERAERPTGRWTTLLRRKLS